MRNGRLQGREKIGLEVGEKLGEHNMVKHVNGTISDDDLVFEIDQDSVEQESLSTPVCSWTFSPVRALHFRRLQLMASSTFIAWGKPVCLRCRCR